MLKIKRIYEPPAKDDGWRVLVDRLWPRGIKKDAVDEWLREIAPSNELRKWYSHQATKWEEFKRRYREELKTKEATLKKLAEMSRKGSLTLLYASKERELNNAVALKEIIEKEFR
ncbi:MAG: DUF488 family protein [Candidatus Saccharicenans sp.]|nr:DUF488 family protein [Candidatus Saccharicenans sp.]